MKFKAEWELINAQGTITLRMKIHGGWLINHQFHGAELKMNSFFVPDENHRWEVELCDADQENMDAKVEFL